MSTTYSQYGVECGEGWKKLYQPLIDLCNELNIEILQVKEKFGGLRFYVGQGGKHAAAVNMAIQTAEEASYHTCEDCGLQDQRKITFAMADDPTSSPWEGKVTTGTSSTSRWIRSLCQKCRDTFDDKRRAEGFKDWVKETPELADQRLRTTIRATYPPVAAEAIIATMSVDGAIHLPTLSKVVIALADAHKKLEHDNEQLLTEVGLLRAAADSGGGPTNGPMGPQVFERNPGASPTRAVNQLREYDDENEQCNAMSCGHANEMPVKCPCIGRCFCKRAGGPCDETW